MSLIIDTPDASNSTQFVTLGGLRYEFVYKFNDRDSRWRLSIALDGIDVKTGIKIMEDQSLLSRYVLPSFDHGDILCIRLENDDNPVGRNNLGLNKSYSLVYFTNEELGIS